MTTASGEAPATSLRIPSESVTSAFVQGNPGSALANAAQKEQALMGGMSRKRAARIHTTLRVFVSMIVDVAKAVLGMARAGVLRYLDGGG